MLASRSRISRHEGFTNTLRLGSRSGNRALVVSVRILRPGDVTPEDLRDIRAGVVVPKREIRKATARNKVKRRLRHLLQPRLATLPPGTRVIVRALRPSAELSYDELGRALDRGLSSSLAKERRKAPDAERLRGLPPKERPSDVQVKCGSTLGGPLKPDVQASSGLLSGLTHQGPHHA